MSTSYLNEHNKYRRLEEENARLREALEAVDFINGVQRHGNVQLVRNMTFGQWKTMRDAALSGSPAPDPAEAMRAKCEAIARSYGFGDYPVAIADEIADLNGNGEVR